MPDMDGLTLLSRMSETSPLIKSVIVSAYGDMDNIRTAMNRGLDRAIDASLAVRSKVAELPASNGSLLFSPKVSIGINSGEMISGYIGSAKLKRLDYTVIGDTVNVAQRLQAVAKQSQIIINEEAYQKLKESFNCSKVGEVNLKNKAGVMNVYEVMD